MTNDTPSSEQPAQAARRRERPPKSADAKQRGLAARKLKRALDTVRASKDAQKMEQAAAALARLDGEAAPREEPPKAEQPAAEPPRKELSAVPPTADATKPGWPSEAQLADAAPSVRHLVDIAAVLLAGTRFDLLVPLKIVVGDKVVEVTKAAILAEKLTPLAAKYGAAVQQTPEILAAVGLLTVFGPPLLETVLEKVSASKLQAAAPPAVAV